MVSISITATERVVGKLAEQARAHTEISASLLLKPATAECKRHAVEHAETARLFQLLHAACLSDGLLDRLQDEAVLSIYTPATTGAHA